MDMDIFTVGIGNPFFTTDTAAQKQSKLNHRLCCKQQGLMEVFQDPENDNAIFMNKLHSTKLSVKI